MNFWRQNPLRCDKWHPPTDPLQAVPSQAVPQPLPSQDPAALIPSVTSSHMEAKQSRHNMQKCIDILKKYIYMYIYSKKTYIYYIYIYKHRFLAVAPLKGESIDTGEFLWFTSTCVGLQSAQIGSNDTFTRRACWITVVLVSCIREGSKTAFLFGRWSTQRVAWKYKNPTSNKLEEHQTGHLRLN